MNLDGSSGLTRKNASNNKSSNKRKPMNEIKIIFYIHEHTLCSPLEHSTEL